MTLTELQNEVITLTGRPDQAARILSAVRASTLRAHNIETWYKDFVEVNHTFGAEAFAHSLDYRTSYPLFKGIKFIKKSDSAFVDSADFIPVVPPESAMDSYNIMLADVAYLAGTTINIKSSTSIRYLRIGIYQYPDVTVGGYDSWIALDQPYAIIYDATAIVMKGIGKVEEAASYAEMARQEFALLSKSNVTPVIE